MRAQVQNIVIFVIGLVVISLVLLFGYTVIKDLNDDRCEIRRTQFATDLQQAIDRNKAWGTNQVVQLAAPCETATVCFVDRSIIDADQPPQDDEYLPVSIPSSQAGIIDASVQAGDQTNVFTISSQGIVEPVERFSSASAAIQVQRSGDAASTCLEIDQETLSVRMEGTGRLVRITGNTQG